MSKIILITGGARSGKSTYAEAIAKETQSKVLYVATAIPFDEEMEYRIKKHRERRDENWLTYEGYKNLKQIFSKKELDFETIVLDCITIMITNLIFHKIKDHIDSLNEEEINQIEKEILEEIKSFLDEGEKNSKDMILVTNEVGFGIVPDNKLSRVFRDIAGRVNQYVASRASRVELIVCGLPVKIK